MALPSEPSEWLYARTWSPGAASPSNYTSWLTTRTWAALQTAPSAPTGWIEARTWTATAYRCIAVDEEGERQWVPMGEMVRVS